MGVGGGAGFSKSAFGIPENPPTTTFSSFSAIDFLHFLARPTNGFSVFNNVKCFLRSPDLANYVLIWIVFKKCDALCVRMIVRSACDSNGKVFSFIDLLKLFPNRLR